MNLPFNESLVIIPTYNEAENVGNMLDKLVELYPELSVLIIDDGSPDGTAGLVREKSACNKRIYLIERPGKLGLGTAYTKGFKWALKKGFKYIFEMDCDFSHNPADLSRLLKACAVGPDAADLAIGSRYIHGIRVINWPLRRLLLSYLAGIYTRLITGLKILDATGGFKCFRASALKKIDLDDIVSSGYSFQIELNYKFFKKGFRLVEVPVVFTERQSGQSKMNFRIILEALIMVFRLRFGSSTRKIRKA